MTKYKDVEKKIDEGLRLSKETGKEHGFNICMSGGGEITTTNIEEGDKNLISGKKCPETKLGSVHIDASPKNSENNA